MASSRVAFQYLKRDEKRLKVVKLNRFRFRVFPQNLAAHGKAGAKKYNHKHRMVVVFSASLLGVRVKVCKWKR